MTGGYAAPLGGVTSRRGLGRSKNLFAWQKGWPAHPTDADANPNEPISKHRHCPAASQWTGCAHWFASARRDPTGLRRQSTAPRSADPRAADAVAVTFARILAERHPGTSWLPVKRDEPGAHLGVPCRKVIRLLPAQQIRTRSAGSGPPPRPPRTAERRTNTAPIPACNKRRRSAHFNSAYVSASGIAKPTALARASESRSRAAITRCTRTAIPSSNRPSPSEPSASQGHAGSHETFTGPPPLRSPPIAPPQAQRYR